ncbi:WbqC family protein [Campylobacter sp. RM16704]|uniref:WbqC family protein n=1 Tax=Campylobacter sp. RM16704 TaxID=1500960 RepID=UPI00057D02E2|nr:WbqC family protein [Campylobacter sp. RM16704]AJC86769.1 WbqC family protein [Campylobacter sp. RM16704]
MQIAIMQPTFLPWMGYFQMINQVDYFILLNDVQFEKQSWQSRNKIKSQNNELFITLHVKKCPLKSKIQDIELIKNQKFRIKILKTLKQNYNKSINFQKYYPLIENILLNSTNLCQTNIELIQLFLKILKINTPLYKSSELNLTPKSKDLYIIDICKYFNATSYLCANGSKAYMNMKLYNEQGIKIQFFNYDHPIYHQTGKNFISHLSIVDLVFNEPNPHLFFQ